MGAVYSSLIKHVIERRPIDEWECVPKYVKGIYCLLNKNGEVVYIGMARGNRSGVRGRLKRHAESASKIGKWTHFSIFQFWENRHPNEIVELEGILRHIYRFDKRKSLLGIQRTYSPLKKATHKTFEEWDKCLSRERG